MTKLSEKFETLISDLDNLTPERVEDLVHESLRFFHQLQTKLTSGDESEKQEAMKIANELSQKFEEQAQKALESTGLSADDLDEFIKDPNNFTEEEWAKMTEANKELEDYKKELDIDALKTKKPVSAPRKKKAAPMWIHG